MRKIKLLKNTITSFGYRIIVIVCGLILPKIILGAFGSEVNGLISSINQFLNIITLLELGVGAVVQSGLYKPLAEKNDDEISKIVASATKFYRTIAFILIGYVTILVLLYPLFINSNFDHFFTSTLIIVISISTFAQYYFGMVDRLLLVADQNGYITYITYSITIIINTLLCAILIKYGAGIHIVKLTTSLVFVIRPFVFRHYVNKFYSINRKITYISEPIEQKWNGMAQHFAAVVLSDADVIILTVMSTLTNVSIYTVYSMVACNIKNLFTSLLGGFTSLYGELWAKKEINKLVELFSFVEWLVHTTIVFVFGCTAVLIVPFVTVYTSNVHDANYTQPIFGVILVIAHAFHCMREPYNMMILAGNHYRQTQNNYITAAIINIVVSIIFVGKFGLVGVAIGTLVAMLYQTVWMAYYNSKNFINWPFKYFVKQSVTDIITFIISFVITSKFELSSVTFLSWIILAFKVMVVWFVIIVFINFSVYKKNIVKLGLRIKNSWR